MYVGQWESRVQAILRDGPPPQAHSLLRRFSRLYHAGISSDASLSVADMLKPFIMRREMRMLAEMTPEAWHALQERDRGLADQFHVLRIAARGRGETRRIMWQSSGSSKATSIVEFAIDALPADPPTSASYIRDAAFPGKAVAFLGDWPRSIRQDGRSARAKSSRNSSENRAWRWNSSTTACGSIASRRRATAGQNRRPGSGRSSGGRRGDYRQGAADADPGRPLATLLFLGPTGVGKTQCAKALAEVMFSDARPAAAVRYERVHLAVCRRPNWSAHSASRMDC